MTKKSRKLLRITRHKRIRKKLFGTADMPRLSVFRSNKHIYVQLINDNDGHTLTSANDSQLTTKNNIEKAEDVGLSIAKNAKEIGVKKIVFDKVDDWSVRSPVVNMEFDGLTPKIRIKAFIDGSKEKNKASDLEVQLMGAIVEKMQPSSSGSAA